MNKSFLAAFIAVLACQQICAGPIQDLHQYLFTRSTPGEIATCFLSPKEAAEAAAKTVSTAASKLAQKGTKKGLELIASATTQTEVSNIIPTGVSNSVVEKSPTYINTLKTVALTTGRAIKNGFNTTMTYVDKALNFAGKQLDQAVVLAQQNPKTAAAIGVASLILTYAIYNGIKKYTQGRKQAREANAKAEAATKKLADFKRFPLARTTTSEIK